MLYALCTTLLQGRPVCSRGPAERQTEALHAGQLSTPLPDALTPHIRRAYLLLIQRREYFQGLYSGSSVHTVPLALQGPPFWHFFCKRLFSLLASKAMNFPRPCFLMVLKGLGHEIRIGWLESPASIHSFLTLPFILYWNNKLLAVLGQKAF